MGERWRKYSVSVEWHLGNIAIASDEVSGQDWGKGLKENQAISGQYFPWQEQIARAFRRIDADGKAESSQLLTTLIRDPKWRIDEL